MICCDDSAVILHNLSRLTGREATTRNLNPSRYTCRFQVLRGYSVVLITLIVNSSHNRAVEALDVWLSSPDFAVAAVRKVRRNLLLKTTDC